MVIKELNLISFGKFENKVISFENGINLLYGENESGKSTIMSFVQFMFYGSTTKKSSIAENIKLKYTPWDSEIIEGELTYSLDGTDYIIHRKAGKRSSVDVLNKNTGESLGNDISKNIGVHLFGLSEDAFVKTLFISQNGVTTGPDKDGILVNRLSNLESDYDEGGSYTKVKKQIEEEKHNLSSPRRSGALIPKLKAENDELKRNLFEIQNSINEIETSKEESARVSDEIKKLNLEKEDIKNKIDLCEKSKLAQSYKEAEEKLSNAKAKLDSANSEYLGLDLTKYKAFESIDDETVNKITFDTGNDTNALTSSAVFAREKAKSAKNMGIASAIGAVICIALGFIYSIAFVAGAIFALIAVYGFMSSGAQNKKANSIDEQIASLNAGKSELLSKYGCLNTAEFIKKHSEYLELSSKKASVETSLEFLTSEYNNAKITFDRISQEIISKYDKLENVLNIFSKCDNIGNIEEMKMRLESISSSIVHLTAKQAVANEKLSGEKDLFDELITTKESIEHNDKLISAYEKRLNVLDRALDILEKSFVEIKNNFAPKLNKNAGRILSKITDEKYKNLLINHDFDTRIDSGKGYYESPYFSGGTIDQLYFAVRFGIIETVKENEKNYPVFLDDVFCQCDAKRLYGAVGFLEKYSKESQIIYSTCHERERSAFENAGGCNIVNL